MTREQEKIYTEQMSTYTRVNNALTATFKRYNDLEDLYLFHTPKVKNSSKSNVFDPMAYEQVEHEVAHLYAQDPKGEFLPTEPSDDLNVEVMNELWQYQWNKDDADMYRKIANTLRRSKLYGTAWGVVHWRYERQESKILKKMITTWDDPCYYDLNNYDCFPDIDAQSHKDMKFFIHDEYLSLDDLETQNTYFKGKKRYVNLNELKELLGDSEAKAATVDNAYRNHLLTRRKLDDHREMEGRIKVRRCYYPDRWITILPDYNLLIEDNPNPYVTNELPVVCLPNQDLPGIILGVGEIDPVRTLMLTMNQVINMRLDNIKMILEKPMVARKSAIEHLKTWVWGRNRVMIVNQDGDLKPLDMQDVTGNTFVSTLQWLQDVIRTRSGRGDLLTNNRGNKTATEIDAMAAEQNARLKYKANNFENFIRELSVKMMQLNQQFLTQTRAIRIVGNDKIQKINQSLGDRFDSKGSYGFLKVDPSDIAGQFDFRVESGSTRAINSERETRDLLSALQLGMQYSEVLMQQGKEFDPVPILEMLINRLGVKNIEQVIKDGQAIDAGALSALQPQQLSSAPGLPQ